MSNEFFMDFIEDAQLTDLIDVIEEDRNNSFYVPPTTDEISVEKQEIDEEDQEQDEPKQEEEEEAVEEEEIRSRKEIIVPDVQYNMDYIIAQEMKKTPTKCEDFFDISAIAERCLDELFKKSTETEKVVPEPKRVHFWPKVSEFTSELGMLRIQEYVQSWIFNNDWNHSIFLVHRQSNKCSDFHIYKTMWNMPNKEYPVSQCVASIFFIIEVPRVLPDDCIVNVTYHYEGNAYRHSAAERTEVNEEHLYRILVAKLRLFKTVTF